MRANVASPCCSSSTVACPDLDSSVIGVIVAFGGFGGSGFLRFSYSASEEKLIHSNSTCTHTNGPPPFSRSFSSTTGLAGYPLQLYREQSSAGQMCLLLPINHSLSSHHHHQQLTSCRKDIRMMHDTFKYIMLPLSHQSSIN